MTRQHLIVTDIDRGKLRIDAFCPGCEKRACPPLEVKANDFYAWDNGILIQDALPTLSVSEREALISGTCDACWAKLFGGEK